MKLERTILRELIFNDEYARKVLPFLESDYFTDRTERLIFNKIDGFIEKYNSRPSIEALLLGLKESTVSDEELKLSQEILKEANQEKTDIGSGMLEKPNMDWLLDTTEQFCQEKAVYNAVLESIQILDGKSKTQEKGAIPKILEDALAVGFDNNIGHDYLEDASDRYDFFHRTESKIPFDLEYFNKITKGGLKKKTLNVCLAGTNVGKSLLMCHMAAACMSQGKNVLYVTLEMSEEEIANRIDANLLNVPMDDLLELPKDIYQRKVDRVRGVTTGKLIVKEYPTAAASTINFKHLLHELNLKKNFVPDIIFIDYLNICCSARIKAGANVNSYTYVKAIAEELRGMAVEFDVPIMTATQTNRTGFTNSDPGLEDTSESFGLPATADLMFSLTTSEDLEALGQLMVKQLKNRYSSKTIHKRFVIGVDYPKMRLFDVEQSAQDLSDSGKPDDKPLNTFGKKPDKAKFGGIKVN